LKNFPSGGKTMEARKFAIGDRVRLQLGSYANDNPADVYTISRALPEVANVWQYRVKRVGDGQERAVSEQQLARAGFQALASQSMAAAQQDMQRIRNARASARTRVAARRSERETH
jgi:hypothetical protein